MQETSHKTVAINVSLHTVTVSFLEQYRQYIVLIYRLWNLLQDVVMLGLCNTRRLVYPFLYCPVALFFGGNSLYSVNICGLQNKKKRR
jgi:hypothetical protein